MTRILIVRYGEVALKGMNKPYFERVLEGRVKKSLSGIEGAGELKIERRGGLIVVSGAGETLPVAEGELIRRVSRVFGVASVSPAVRLVSRELSDISAAAIEYMKGILADGGGKSGAGVVTRHADSTKGLLFADGNSDSKADGEPTTFKIYAKRSDKTYPVTSPELAAKVGEAVLDAFGSAVKVDVKHPDVRLTVHLRVGEVFIYDEKHDGFGGLPLGTNGKGMVLLSGGIDSPVAAWLMAKRGMRPEAVHYHSYPYTSGRAREKVEELAAILAGYCGGFRMHVVNLLPAQEAIAKHCPEEFMTILVRRFMMRIAELIARAEDCNMLVTGESLGQVASQTAESLFVTDAVVGLPVMRPLIALDKTDIMDLAREIGTYEKSIEPYEDCCTVFLPKHPVTRPKLSDIEAAEANIPDMDGLIRSLVESKEMLTIRP
ncbi:MAG: tRNA 4-thiouridine(8) synthase ThiI [Clostridiales Family XIII bacterium]|jgi:thiamine biosynthesis protein ThiI|nr:tRNA 4-thiouridine(8) synthase ThiI [Clostridiales Family XIII bacterium]